MTNWYKYSTFTISKKNRILLLLSGALFFGALFIKFSSEVFEDNVIQHFDQSILLNINQNIRHSYLNEIAVDITNLGSSSFILILSLLVICVLILAKDRKGAIYLFFSVSGATLCSVVLKEIVARPRPEIISHLVKVEDLSYPSGHSLVAAVTYLAIAFLTCRHLKSYKLIALIYVTAFFLIILISFSRLYLGVHYPSDVFSGILFGVSWVLLLTSFYKIFDVKIENP